MSRSRKPTEATIASTMAALMPSSKRNDMFAFQATGLLKCNVADHLKNDRGGFTVGGFIAHLRGRSAKDCNVADVVATLLRDGIITPAEALGEAQVDLAEVAKRAGKVLA